MYQAPQYVAPNYQAPQYVAPNYQAPQYVAPNYQAPGAPDPRYAAPTYGTPTYGTPTYGTSAASVLGSPTSLMPTSLRPGSTPLDGPGFADPGLNVGTPIFDEISAWFFAPARLEAGEHGGTNGRSHPGTNHWASLRDAGWREASARAAAGPQVAGSTGSGLPMRAPGANMLPSAADAAPGMARSFNREVPRADPGRVRHRLDSFQQGVQTARQLRDHLTDTASSGLSVPSGREAAERPAVPEASGPPGSIDTSGATDMDGDGGGRRGREGGFGAFYRDYLPQLLALLMIEGARPSAAAQVAQDAMSEAYREWAQLENPREWTRQVALSSWAVQRRSSGESASAGSPGAAAAAEPPAGPRPTRPRGSAAGR
jgi:hypothetical protein